MPDALLRACTHCGNPTSQSPCASCATKREHARGSAHARGYTRLWREWFKPKFEGMLVKADIAPVCGASLPGGPNTKAFSECARTGLLNAANLHLDHEPPLLPEERRDKRKVCDPLRVGLLCRRDHGIKTREEQVRAHV